MGMTGPFLRLDPAGIERMRCQWRGLRGSCVLSLRFWFLRWVVAISRGGMRL
jgi:hypothetical protein